MTAFPDPAFCEVVCMPDDPNWQACRLLSIGASEAAQACGVGEYGDQLSLYAKKLGLMPDIEDSDAMRLGRKLEPVVVEEFRLRTGNGVVMYPCPTVRSVSHPWISATPDAVLEEGLLECKTTTWRTEKTLGEDGSDFVPNEWLLQSQQQMFVTGASVVHLAALIDGRKLRTFVIHRNQELIDALVRMETELWQRIERREPPEPNWNHPRTPELVKILHPTVSDREVVLPQEVELDWMRQEQIGEQIAALTKEREILRAKVLLAMEDAGRAPLADGRILERRKTTRKGYYVESKEYLVLSARKPKE